VLPSGSYPRATRVQRLSPELERPEYFRLRQQLESSGSLRMVRLTGTVRHANKAGFGIFTPDDRDEDLLMRFDFGPGEKWSDEIAKYEDESDQRTRVSIEVEVPGAAEE
jgi:hypothetical protein